MKNLSIALLFLLCVGQAFSQNVGADGNHLLINCQVAVKDMDSDTTVLTLKEEFQAGYCTGLVRGIISAADLNTPASSTTGQFIRIVVKFLQSHPEELHKPEEYLVRVAIIAAYPKLNHKATE